MIRVTYGLGAANLLQSSTFSGEFARSVVVIGRSKSCDLVISDEEMSGRHCELRVLAGGLFVIDSGSTDGTYVNGERIDARLIGEDDVVRIGATVLRAVYVKSDASAASPKLPMMPRQLAPSGTLSESMVRSIEYSGVEEGVAPALPAAVVRADVDPEHVDANQKAKGDWLEDWGNRFASNHPLLLFAASLSFFVALTQGAQAHALQICAEVLAIFWGGGFADAFRVLIPVFEIEVLAVIVATCLITLELVVVGQFFRLLWRIRRFVLWFGGGVFLLILVFGYTKILLLFVAVIVVLELVYKHFRNQALILEELRRNRRD